MWKVYNTDMLVLGVFDTLDSAMEAAKCVNEFVTISNGTMDFVGMFGVDSIKDGLCPDGVCLLYTSPSPRD